VREQGEMIERDIARREQYWGLSQTNGVDHPLGMKLVPRQTHSAHRAQAPTPP